MSPEEPQPLTINTARMLEIGMAIWGVALVVALVVPSLHQGDRQWWPWTCVAGIVGGGLAVLSVSRGRGHLAGAHHPPRLRRPRKSPTSKR